MNMPHCSAQKQCGACQLLSLPYEKQLERKQNEMIELFEPFAGEGTVFNPIAGMDEPYYYRNKAERSLGARRAMSVPRAHRSTKSFAACTQLARTASSTPIPAF